MAAAVLAGMLLLATAATTPAISPAMAIAEVESGRTASGQPWFVVSLGQPFPPIGLFSWYLGVAVGTDRGQVQYVTQLHDGERETRLSGASGRVQERILPDGRVMIVLPVRAERSDPFVVLSGQRAVEGEEPTRWARGTGARPLRIASRVADPFELYGTPDPSPNPAPSVVPTPAPIPRTAPASGALDPGTVLLGVLTGLSGLSIFRRRHPGARLVVAGVLALGGAVGAGVGAATIGTQPGAAIGLIAGILLMGFGPSRRVAAP